MTDMRADIFIQSGLFTNWIAVLMIFFSFVWSFFAVIAAAAAVILYYGLMLFIIKVIVTYETIIGYMYVKS